jgi:heme/copper-type cytochrome/quinol oxidase subunit 3
MSPPIEARHQGPNRYQSSRWLWILFFVSALTTVVTFFVPAFIIRPFRHQAPSALLLAMSLRQRAPLFTLVLALTCFIMTYALWRISSRWGKAVLTLAMLVVTFSAVMARLNYFEWMFHPIVGPQFLAQSESKLDPKEMIMAVRVAGDARAYPISQMAYHHVLNDVVGGVPIAVTY